MRRRRLWPLCLLLLLLLVGVAASLEAVRPVPDAETREVGAEAQPGDDASADVAIARRGAAHERARVRAGSEPGDSLRSGRSHADPPDSRSGSADGDGGEHEAESEDEVVEGGEGDASGTSRETRVLGQIVDAATGEGIEDVRILVVRAQSWRGTRSDEGGVFDGVAPEDDGPVELRIGKRGYHTQIVPWTEGQPMVRLQPRDHPPVPGVVTGHATDPSGRPVSGRLLISGYDEMGDHFGQWAIADEGGAFRLIGMPPGHWRLRIEGGDDWVDVIVPEGAPTNAHLVAGAEPWPGELTREQFEERHRAASFDGRTVTDRKQAQAAPTRDPAAWRARLEIQDLECRWRGVAAQRDVLVEGLPDGPNAHLRAATRQGPNHSWRVAVVDGRARFALTAEPWRLHLEVPGEPDVVMPIVVEDGEDVLSVKWSASE